MQACVHRMAHCGADASGRTRKGGTAETYVGNDWPENSLRAESARTVGAGFAARINGTPVSWGRRAGVRFPSGFPRYTERERLTCGLISGRDTHTPLLRRAQYLAIAITYRERYNLRKSHDYRTFIIFRSRGSKGVRSIRS